MWVQRMQQGTLLNYGLMLGTEDIVCNQRVYDSREGPSAYGPELTIAYTLPVA